MKMAKKESTQSTVTIFKSKSHSEHKIILPIDAERQDKFNSGQSIEVTTEELEAIGKHRWLEVKPEAKNVS